MRRSENFSFSQREHARCKISPRRSPPPFMAPPPTFSSRLHVHPPILLPLMICTKKCTRGGGRRHKKDGSDIRKKKEESAVVKGGGRGGGSFFFCGNAHLLPPLLFFKRNRWEGRALGERSKKVTKSKYGLVKKVHLLVPSPSVRCNADKQRAVCVKSEFYGPPKNSRPPTKIGEPSFDCFMLPPSLYANFRKRAPHLYDRLDLAIPLSRVNCRQGL